MTAILKWVIVLWRCSVIGSGPLKWGADTLEMLSASKGGAGIVLRDPVDPPPPPDSR